MIRHLKKPKTFGAALPLGPIDEAFTYATRPCDIANCRVAEFDIHEEYSRWISEAERHLSHLAGHDEGERAAHGGRSDGPSFVWRPACGPPVGDSNLLDGIARAWSLSAEWLRRVASCPVGSRSWRLARFNFSHYRHDWHKCQTPSEVHDIVTFEAWRLAASRCDLTRGPVIQSLVTAATDIADSFRAHVQWVKFKSWSAWLHEGPAGGLGRQHRLSRVATGWIPVPIGVAPAPSLSIVDDVEEVADDWEDMWGSVDSQNAVDRGPMDAQRVAEHEANIWAQQWASSTTAPAMPWPQSLGPLLPRITLDTFRRALASFAAATALGWDALHPRALLRLSDELLIALVRILLVAEFRGEWLAAVALVIIVLLPKPDGGRRPIGLLPLLPRVWMRVRREVVQQWERAHDRPYLYAGPAVAAQVATWRQAARAELASAVGVEYAQALLDLVKAFERIPHDVLLREAIRLDFPFWILRLSLATYRLARVLRVGEVFSSLIWAVRGITAGSAFCHV